MDDIKLEKAQQKAPPKAKENLIIKRIIWFCIILDILIIDQISKWAITELVLRPQSSGQGNSLSLIDWYMSAPPILPYAQIQITSFFNIVIVWNTGVSFSMFSNGGEYMPAILIAVALGIALIFTIWMLRTNSHLFGICYALIIGGALGNIVDRARFGAVIDFLDFHVAGYHWPAFNVADMAVVSGVVILIIVSIFFKQEEETK